MSNSWICQFKRDIVIVRGFHLKDDPREEAIAFLDVHNYQIIHFR